MYVLIILDLSSAKAKFKKNNATEAAITTGTNFLLNAFVSNHFVLNIKMNK